MSRVVRAVPANESLGLTSGGHIQPDTPEFNLSKNMITHSTDRRNRFIFGSLSLAIGVGVTLVLLLTGTSRWYRCLLFLPYAIAVTLLWMGAKGQ